MIYRLIGDAPMRGQRDPSWRGALNDVDAYDLNDDAARVRILSANGLIIGGRTAADSSRHGRLPRPLRSRDGRGGRRDPDLEAAHRRGGRLGAMELSNRVGLLCHSLATDQLTLC